MSSIQDVEVLGIRTLASRLNMHGPSQNQFLSHI